MYTCSRCQVSRRLWTVYETVSSMQQVRTCYTLRTCYHAMHTLHCDTSTKYKIVHNCKLPSLLQFFNWLDVVSRSIIVFLHGIHSNKRPGHLDKSFWMGAYLFQYLLQRSTLKFMILAIFKLISNHIELSMLISWVDLGRWLITYGL